MASHNTSGGEAYVDPDSFDLSGVGGNLGCITWLRPAKIFSAGYTLWGSNDDASALAQPDDVHQGHFGDCFLIAAMAAIAEEHPERLRSILPATHIQSSGAYAVVMWWRGEWTVVTVDDAFPCVKSEGVDTPLCASSRPGKTCKLWPLIVEKVRDSAARCRGSALPPSPSALRLAASAPPHTRAAHCTILRPF
jgi:hypothetical protein